MTPEELTKLVETEWLFEPLFKPKPAVPKKRSFKGVLSLLGTFAATAVIFTAALGVAVNVFPLPKPEPLGAPSPQASGPNGHLQLNFDKIKDKANRQRMAKYTEMVLPLIEKINGPAWQDMKVSVMADDDLDDHVAADFRAVDCRPGHLVGEIHMQPGVVVNFLKTLVHELGHAWRGCYTFGDGRFEEGLAEASQMLVNDELSQKNGSALNPRQLSILNVPGIGPGASNFSDYTHSPLTNLRYLQAGSMFAFFEGEHPGFMRDFNAAAFARLQRFGRDFQFDLLSTALSVQPAFWEVVKQAHLFDPRPQGDQLLVIPRFTDASTTSINGFDIACIGRDADGHEKPLAGLGVKVSVDDGYRFEDRRSLVCNDDGIAAYYADKPMLGSNEYYVYAIDVGRQMEVDYTFDPRTITINGPGY